MNSIKRNWIVFGIIFVFIFSGCSIPTDFYIQNLTGTQKVLKINYKKEALRDFQKILTVYSVSTMKMIL